LKVLIIGMFSDKYCKLQVFIGSSAGRRTCRGNEKVLKVKGGKYLQAGVSPFA
jgi:hypothetical protein